jgi:hypothetical protein
MLLWCCCFDSDLIIIIVLIFIFYILRVFLIHSSIPRNQKVSTYRPSFYPRIVCLYWFLKISIIQFLFLLLIPFLLFLFQAFTIETPKSTTITLFPDDGNLVAKSPQKAPIWGTIVILCFGHVSLHYFSSTFLHGHLNIFTVHYTPLQFISVHRSCIFVRGIGISSGAWLFQHQNHFFTFLASVSTKSIPI